MAEIKPVGGPGQPPDSSRTKKDRTSAEGFKEAYSKVEKTEEAHPDQPKKKRAQRGEEEDLSSTSDEASAAQPTVPPFMAPSKPTLGKTFSVEGPSPKGPVQQPLATPPPSFESTEPNEAYWEEEPLDETPQVQQPITYQQQQPPVTQQTVTYGPPQTPQSSSTPQSRPVQSTRQAQPSKREATPSLEKTQPTKKTEELKEEDLLTGEPIPPSPLTEKKAIEKKEEPSSDIAGIGATVPGLAAFQETPPTTRPAYFYLHPAVYDIFEKMVGVMTVMSSSDINETVVTLNSPQYSSSVFFGAKITITEYATAPKQFNIELTASPEAVAIFDENVDDLVAAFQGGNFNFKVNRLETRLGIPLVRRKESASDEGKK